VSTLSTRGEKQRSLFITTMRIAKLIFFYSGTQGTPRKRFQALLKGPRNIHPADCLLVTKLREHDGRDVDVAGGTAGAAVGNRGHDGVAVGSVDADLLAADRALVGVCVDAVVLS
jgi:hypothetical protein